MKTDKKRQNSIKYVLKNQKLYVIISLPNIVNKQTNNKTNKTVCKTNAKKGTEKRMLTQTMTIEAKNECMETEVFPQFVDFESTALYLVSKFFKTKLKNGEGEYALMHCTVHKVEKLLAIAEFIYLKQGGPEGLFAEDIIIKNCGVGFDVLDWVPTIINMRKFENVLDTGEDNKAIVGRCIIDNSLEVPAAFHYKKEKLDNNIASIIDNVFIQFANYKANYLGASIDKFKDLIGKEDLKTIDKQKVANFFNAQYDELENNDVYNFIANYKF